MRARFFLSVLGVFALHAPAQTVVTDQAGRSVAIPDRVDRIATLVIPGASMAVAVDLGANRLAGVHPSARREIVNGLLGRMMPETRSIPFNLSGDGFVPNVEAILAAKPDVVVQWGDRGNAIVDPISSLGLPVLTLRYGSSELTAEWLRLMGKALTGREARAEELASRFLSVRKAVEMAAAGVLPDRRPKVAYLYRAQGNSFQVAGKNTSMDSDIRLAGGINVAAELPGFAQVSVEQLLAWQPDVLLLNNFEKGICPGAFFTNRLLSAIPAVRGRRVYLYPQGGFRWDPPSHESPLTWRWLLTLFHPDMETSALRPEIEKSYRMLYGYSPASADLDAILRIEENGGSLHYLTKFSRAGSGL
jgi:iron complex transport system substrate-binding protein